MSRWCNRDYVFRAAYNRSLSQLHEHALPQLHAMLDDSVRVLRDAVQHDDLRAALAVLKGTGLLRPFPTRIGSDDPERLQAEEEIAENRLHARWLRTRGGN